MLCAEFGLDVNNTTDFIQWPLEISIGLLTWVTAEQQGPPCPCATSRGQGTAVTGVLVLALVALAC